MRKIYWACLGMLVAIMLMPARAEAKGIPIIYNTGDEVFATGPLPEPFDKVPELAGYEAGYMCQVKGVLWSYFSVSGCKPVAFKGDTYTDEPELVKVLTAKYSEADMQRGFWGRFGWMLMALAVVVGGLLWLKEFFTGKSDAEAEEQPTNP